MRKTETGRYKSTRDHLIMDLFEIAEKVFGYTIAELSLESGVSTSTLYRLRAGKSRFPQFATLFAIAQCIGSETWVISGKGSKVRRQVRLVS